MEAQCGFSCVITVKLEDISQQGLVMEHKALQLNAIRTLCWAGYAIKKLNAREAAIRKWPPPQRTYDNDFTRRP